MGNEWSAHSLYELADYVNGRATKPSELVADGIPVIKIAELHRGISDRTNRIPVKSVRDRHWVRNGDLLFAWSGSVGVHVYRGPDAALNQHIFRVVARDTIDQRFLRYLLSAQMDTFQAFVENKKTTMGHVTVRDLKATSVRVPPLPEQRAIAHILGTLDDKIELNRRMNQTLEEMARALFRSWFVDFDPVRAKATLRQHDLHANEQEAIAASNSQDSEWTVERVRAYLDALDPQIVDLFPDRLVDSELGKIPEGWEVKALGDMADISSGKRPARRVSVADGEMQIPLWGGNGPMGFVAEALVDFPIMLTGRVGTLGSVFRITAPCWPSDNTLIMRANSTELFNFLFLHMSTIDFDSLNRGSTQPLLTQGDLKVQRAITPTGDVLDRFSELTADLFDKIDRGRRQSQSLRLIRDCLLPWLLSGETQVRSIG